jgi:hypothetical protein
MNYKAVCITAQATPDPLIILSPGEGANRGWWRDGHLGGGSGLFRQEASL